MAGPTDIIESKRADRAALRRFILICLSFVLLCIALKSPTWFAPRAESDEQIYWTLARSLNHRGVYSLQGTGAIEALQLPAHTYDRPLFHHPPLVPVLLMPFAAARNPNAAIVISWLGHVLAIVGIALAGWAWRRPNWRGTELLLWLPVMAVAVDPLLAFCSRKLWIDAWLAGLDALALGLVVMAVSRQRIAWFIASGVVFGLAGLSKLTGLIPLLPALIWAFVALQTSPRRQSLLAGLLVPTVLLVSPWMIYFRMKCGAWLPHWNVFPAELASTVPHVARAAARAWHYYAVQAAIIAPITVVCAIRLFWVANRARTGRAALGAAVILFVGVVMTVLGLQGQGFQMRYLAPAVGGLYLLLAGQMGAVDARRSVFPAVATACVLFGCIQTGFYFQAVEYDEIVSIPEMIWKVLNATSASGGGG